MTKNILGTQPLRSIFWFSGTQTKVYNVAIVLLSSLLIAAAAQIRVPMVPVPVTLQTFAVLLIGMSLGWRLGVLSVMVYLFEGAIGMPVFHGFSGGMATLFGVTGGYLLSFPVVAGCCGWLAQRWGNHFLSVLITALIGGLLILILGTAYLAIFIGWQKALVLGMLPFFFGDTLKAIMIAVIVPTLWKRQA